MAFSDIKSPFFRYYLQSKSNLVRFEVLRGRVLSNRTEEKECAGRPHSRPFANRRHLCECFFAKFSDSTNFGADLLSLSTLISLSHFPISGEEMQIRHFAKEKIVLFNSEQRKG